MGKLTNTQIKTLVNTAYQQFTGQTETMSELDLTAFTDTGENAIGEDDREKFTGALLGVIAKTWYTDTSYRSEYNDIYYEDAERFGAITQMIHAEAPDVIDNAAWGDFVSGTTKVGQYTVYIPVIDNKLYTKTVSWALPVTVTGEQWDTAFHNGTELASFVAYLFMMVENKILEHMENMGDENRNNFISEKMIYAKTPTAKGKHVVDLVAEYVAEKGITTTTTAESLLNNREFLVFAAAKMDEYLGYFYKQTALFNTEQKVRFTPKDRIACEILERFETKMTTIGYANTFHDDYVKLPNHKSVPWWQSADDLSWEAISGIHVKSKSGTTETHGIVGFICDKWAIAHTIISNRVGSQHFNIENLTHYEYQHRDKYMNNLTLNAVVFVMNDFTGTASA